MQRVIREGASTRGVVDGSGDPVDLSDLAGRRVKRTARHGETIVVTVDDGDGQPGVRVVFPDADAYESAIIQTGGVS